MTAARSTTAAAWATANLSLSNAIATVGKLRVAFGVLGAAIIGWGDRDVAVGKFEIVRKAGIFMVEVLMKGIEHLRFQWEVFAAIFTSDTIAGSHQAPRTAARGDESHLRRDVRRRHRRCERAKGAMNTAATAAEEIAKRLEAVRQGTQEAVGRGIEAVHAALEKPQVPAGRGRTGRRQGQRRGQRRHRQDGRSLQGLTSIVEASLAQQVQAVKNRYDQEKAELERTQQSETAKITKSTQLLTEALTQQATLRRQATTETLGLIDQETQARKDAAARQGQTEDERRANVQRVENDILATKRQTWRRRSEYRQHIDALNAEANRHLAEVQRIEEAKRQLSMSTEERIRDIRRQGMTEYRPPRIASARSPRCRNRRAGRWPTASWSLPASSRRRRWTWPRRWPPARPTRPSVARKRANSPSRRCLRSRSSKRSRARPTAGREYQQATDLMRQADQLRAELAQKAKDADAQAAQGKQGVRGAIDRIRQSEESSTRRWMPKRRRTRRRHARRSRRAMRFSGR